MHHTFSLVLLSRPFPLFELLLLLLFLSFLSSSHSPLFPAFCLFFLFFLTYTWHIIPRHFFSTFCSYFSFYSLTSAVLFSSFLLSLTESGVLSLIQLTHTSHILSSSTFIALLFQFLLLLLPYTFVSLLFYFPELDLVDFPSFHSHILSSSILLDLLSLFSLLLLPCVPFLFFSPFLTWTCFVFPHSSHIHITHSFFVNPSRPPLPILTPTPFYSSPLISLTPSLAACLRPSRSLLPLSPPHLHTNNSCTSPPLPHRGDRTGVRWVIHDTK